MSYYYIIKTAVYDHGVFWIGTSEEEGKQKVDEFCDCDRDDHHDWQLRKFCEPGKEDFGISDKIDIIVYESKKDL